MRDYPNANEMNLAFYTLSKGYTSDKQALLDAFEEFREDQKQSILNDLISITNMLRKKLG